MSEYLWDRSGPPDPDIEHIEHLLEPLRHRGELKLLRAGWHAQWAGIAAALALGFVSWRLLSPPASRPTQWTIAEINGNVRVGYQAARTAQRIPAGVDLTTGDSSRVELEAEGFAPLAPYLLDGTEVILGLFQGRMISVDPPQVVELTVTETAPVMKNATATAQTKEALLETGLRLQVPPYLETGDRIKVDTRDGRFISRA